MQSSFPPRTTKTAPFSRQQAMHHALSIDEVLRLIFAYVAHADLVRLACTCQIFTDPALDLCWHSISSIEGLLLLIPGLKIIEGALTRQLPTRAVLTYAAWKRFHSYAPRIKSLHHRTALQCDPDLYDYLKSNRPPSGFLPSLRHASFSHHGTSPLAMLFTTSSSLQKIDIRNSFASADMNNMKAMESWFDDLVWASPPLAQLSLRGAVFPPLSNWVTLANSVTSLTLHTRLSIQLVSLAAILTFPHMLSLDLHAGSHSPYDLDPFLPRGTSILPKVHTLRIRGHSPLLLYIISRSSQLATLRIELEDPSIIPIITWRSLLSVIGTRCRLLEDLAIDHHIDIDEEELLEISSPPHPQPLLTIHSRPPSPSPNFRTQAPSASLLGKLGTLHSLRKISLDTTIPFSTCDADMDHVPTSWPALEHLDLGASVVHAHFTKLTLSSLATLTNGLPRLKSLIVPIILAPQTKHLPETHPALRRLTLASLSSPLDLPDDCLLPLLSRYPALSSLDGLAAHEPSWDSIAQVMWRRLKEAA